MNLDLDYTPEVFETACKKSLLLALLIVYFHNDNNPSISGLVVKMEDPAYHPLAGHQVGAPVSLLLALSMVGGWVLGGFFCKLQARPFLVLLSCHFLPTLLDATASCHVDIHSGLKKK